MAQDPSTAQIARRLQERVDALSMLSKSLLATMVVRGLLNRQDILALVEAAGESLQSGGGQRHAREELDSIAADLPARVRIAVGSHASGHHDDH